MTKIENIANLESLPKPKSEHLWADYIELLALQNLDSEMTRADLLSRVQERKDLGEIESVGLNEESNGATVDDKLDLFINDCFMQIEYRIGAFEDVYPFMLAEKGRILRRKEKLSSLNKLYVFFLLAANLRYINEKRRHDITSMFEIASLEALKNYLPRNASTILFGSNPRNTNERYKGKLSKKIFNLAEDLHERPLIQEEDVDERNSGDAGLDIVAYLPFEDKAEGMLYIFCQCACSEDWVSKQHDCSHQAWENKIKFTSLFPHMVFMPFCFRDATGRWFDHLKIYKSILIDRVRLINLLKNNPESVIDIGDLPTVDEYLSERETLF